MKDKRFLQRIPGVHHVAERLDDADYSSKATGLGALMLGVYLVISVLLGLAVGEVLNSFWYGLLAGIGNALLMYAVDWAIMSRPVYSRWYLLLRLPLSTGLFIVHLVLFSLLGFDGMIDQRGSEQFAADREDRIVKLREKKKPHEATLNSPPPVPTDAQERHRRTLGVRANRAQRAYTRNPIELHRLNLKAAQNKERDYDKLLYGPDEQARLRATKELKRLDEALAAQEQARFDPARLTQKERLDLLFGLFFQTDNPLLWLVPTGIVCLLLGTDFLPLLVYRGLVKRQRDLAAAEKARLEKAWRKHEIRRMLNGAKKKPHDPKKPGSGK